MAKFLPAIEKYKESAVQLNSVTEKKQSYYNSHHYNGWFLLRFYENLMVET